MKPILVVGGGPAGLTAAIHAAYKGNPVILVEKNRDCGVKLLATGGGHCNIGNLLPMPSWPECFGRHGRFIVPALEFFPTAAMRSWFARIGVPTHSPDSFHLYPCSNSARDVRNALVDAATSAGVRICTGAQVTRLALPPAHPCPAVITTAGSIEGSAIIVCCDGKSYPATGSDGQSYALLQEYGHILKYPVPALVGLRVKSWHADLAGLVLPDAKASFKIKGRQAETGTNELLLTHHGVSGPAVLDLSGSVTEYIAKNPGQPAVLEVAWRGEMDRKAWETQFSHWRQTRGGTTLSKLFSEYFPKKLVKLLLSQSNVPAGLAVAQLADREKETLIKSAVSFTMEILGDEGWDKAMITRGGIDLAKIDPQTMASKLVDNLYFAGEMLDIDGPCGGYNLHWAWASGALAGASA